MVARPNTATTMSRHTGRSRRKYIAVMASTTRMPSWVWNRKVHTTAPTGNKIRRGPAFSLDSPTSCTIYRATRPMSREKRKF